MIGRTLGHYAILDQLGSGAMGDVYLAADTKLQRRVALKVLPEKMSADHKRLERFRREARSVAALNHPNIVTVHSVEESESTHFLTMEFVEGRSLEELIPGDGLPQLQVLDIAISLADALAAAHGKGLVHRDLKPDNIMVTDDGRVKVLDFGLAKLIEGTHSPDISRFSTAQDLTRRGQVIGTPSYMSPEQLEGKELNPQSDIFSLGVLIYEMATGRRPFRGDSWASYIVSVLQDEPASITELKPELPRQLARIVKHCLEKDLERRFQSALEVRNELEELRREVESPGRFPTAGAAAAPDDKSIAVLPFANLSADPENEFFSDGVSEEILSALGRLPQLRVAARTSCFSFKGKKANIQQVASALNVGTVLEGSVRRAGERIRITAQLIDAGTGYQLWSERFDRNPGDIFAIQDEIATTIASKLEVTLGEASGVQPWASVRPQDLETYHLYLKGRYFWNKRAARDLKKSVGYFEKALDRDPAYALAWAGLADSLLLLGYYCAGAPGEIFPRAKEAARQALELDPALAEAHCSLALAKLLYDWDWQGAEAGFGRALELNPGYPTAHHWFAQYLAFLGRHQESITESRRALALDPLSLILNVQLGWSLYYARHYDEAIEQLRRTLRLASTFSTASFWLALAYEKQGRFDEAMEAFDRAITDSNRAPLVLAAWGRLLAERGEADRARQVLDELLEAAKTIYLPAYYIAALHCGSGEREETLRWLERAASARDGWMVYINVDPIWDAYREEPRFRALVREVGLSERAPAGRSEGGAG